MKVSLKVSVDNDGNIESYDTYVDGEIASSINVSLNGEVSSIITYPFKQYSWDGKETLISPPPVWDDDDL